ncbi:MAG: hypothetical protein LC774_11355 [Acidobacteria bacterium]|nr:hypothetical protein [Acidobacteriota bacterium]
MSQPRPGANAKTYRGSLNDRGLEMRLAWDGERVSGSYAYDGIAQEIGLEGRSTGKEKFDLSERDAAGKTTGKWSCDGERQGEWDQDFSCKWTKADGSGELFVALFEQAASPSGWRVAPKTAENRKAGVRWRARRTPTSTRTTTCCSRPKTSSASKSFTTLTRAARTRAPATTP